MEIITRRAAHAIVIMLTLTLSAIAQQINSLTPASAPANNPAVTLTGTANGFKTPPWSYADGTWFGQIAFTPTLCTTNKTCGFRVGTAQITITGDLATFSAPILAGAFSRFPAGQGYIYIDWCNDTCLSNQYPFTIGTTTLSILSGDQQTVALGKAAAPLVVMTASNGQPVSGLSISYAVTSRPQGSTGDSLNPATTPTTTSGTASTLFTPGNANGSYQVTASCSTCTPAAVTFTTTVVPPRFLRIISGSGQVGTEGEPLASPLTVATTDATGKPVPGVAMTFAVSQRPAGSSGDSLGTPNPTTAVNGQASTTFTPGHATGAYQITASCAACTPASVTFSETASFVPITITTSPAGLHIRLDNQTVTSPHTASWAPGSTHVVSVVSPQGTATDRYVFSSWSNGGAETQNYLTPAAAQTLTASMLIEHHVRIVASPAGSGHVIGGGWWPEGFPVTVAASPNPGWQFSSLMGSLSSNYPWFKETLTTALDITAYFVPRVANAHQVYLTPTGVAGQGNGTKANPYQTPTAHAFDAVMRGIVDDTEVVLAPGVFLTYGANAGYGNCQSIGEIGWIVGKRWWIHGSGIGSTTVRLGALCQVSTAPGFNGALIYVIGTPYYQDNSDSIVSDLTVDGNYPAFGTHIFDWKENIGAVSLNGSRCTIRNVKGINLYGWFVDPHAPGQINLAEDFSFSIASPLNPQTNTVSPIYGNLIEGSEITSSGGGYIDGFQIFSGDGRQNPLPLTDETAAGLPGGIIRHNTCLNFNGVSCFGFEGKGIVVDSNTALNVNNAIRGDSAWMLDISITNNHFINLAGTSVTFSADLNTRFRRNVIARNTFQATNLLNGQASSPWVVFFKQSGQNTLDTMLVEGNLFLYHDGGSHLVPSAMVLQGNTPGPQNIRMIDNRMDPIYLQRGQNCPTQDEPICQTGLSTPTYFGSGNVTTTNVPIAKYNRTIP